MNLHTFEKSNFEKPALINERLLLPQAYFPMHTDQGHSEGMTAAAAVTLAPHRSTDSLSNGQGSDFQVYSPLAACKKIPIRMSGSVECVATRMKAQVLKISTGYLWYYFITFSLHSSSVWKP